MHLLKISTKVEPDLYQNLFCLENFLHVKGPLCLMIQSIEEDFMDHNATICQKEASILILQAHGPYISYHDD